jgi:hypothetical protein
MVASAAPKLFELNDEEGCLIGDSLDILLDLARAATVATEYTLTLGPEQLDETWAPWFTKSQGGPAAAAVVQAFGIGLGDWLVRRFNFVWKAVEIPAEPKAEPAPQAAAEPPPAPEPAPEPLPEPEPEPQPERQLAVLGQPGNMLMYPIEVVAERYLAGQEWFFSELAIEIEEVVARARV